MVSEEYNCECLESILNEWYKIINTELFENKLNPISIEVYPEFFFFSSGSLAQYCIPKNDKPFIRFNLEGLVNVRNDFIESALEEGWDPSIENVEEETKQIIAGTLIHEMIHQYSRENNIEDAVIIDGIDIHTKTFKKMAEEKGLLVLPDCNGDSNTHIRPDHFILNKLQYHDFLENDYPTDDIITEWYLYNDEI